MAQMYEDVVLRPRHDGKNTPRAPCVMDCVIRPQTHATSVTTREGNTKMEVQGLSFWLGVPHSTHLFLFPFKAWGLSFSKAWDLSMIFNSLFLTSNDKQHLQHHHLHHHHPTYVSAHPLSQAFIFAQPLNQALRQPHWNRHGPEEARLLTEYPLILLSLCYKTAE